MLNNSLITISYSFKIFIIIYVLVLNFKKNPSTYIYMDDLIALKIDYKYIYYKCDNCIKINKRILSSNTKKKDKIFANYHICNSYNDLSNRQIRIKSNCIYAQQEFINLHITNNTLKIK